MDTLLTTQTKHGKFFHTCIRNRPHKVWKSHSGLFQVFQFTEGASFTKPLTKSQQPIGKYGTYEHSTASAPAPSDKCFFYLAPSMGNTSNSPSDLVTADPPLWRCRYTQRKNCSMNKANQLPSSLSLKAAEGLVLDQKYLLYKSRG